MGATDTVGRFAASVGASGPPPIQFKASSDIPNAGVLLALPSLLAVGLLFRTDEQFKLPQGYYRLHSVFLLVALMALARLKSAESLRYCAPGEWGKILGLDRIPEVRTLRQKIRLLAQGTAPAQWSADLCRDWMQAKPEEATLFYVDGHVRVYHGEAAHLPRRYVARQKLCLRGSIDYWVNAMDGQPFFLIHKDIDPKLCAVLEKDIVPRLMEDAPNQATEEELSNDPLLHRFTVIFDREGYSPDLIARLKKLRVACLTYRKFVYDEWERREFLPYRVRLASGEEVDMKLAERGVKLEPIWVREVRRLTDTGHQTSILATDYKSDLTRIAVAMFARWSQENFFKYARENFSIDRLVDYGCEDIPDKSALVVSPEYRRLDIEVRKTRGRLNRAVAELASLKLPLEPDRVQTEAFEEKKAIKEEAIMHLRTSLEKSKSERKATTHHVPLAELPEAERFTRLSPQAKHLTDTIKMIAYRAETAMAHILREKMSRQEDSRALLKAIYKAEADLRPDIDKKTLTVRLHHLANRSNEAALRHLCQELNSTETVFPDTDLRLVYELMP
jgi:hypothetical protein